MTAKHFGILGFPWDGGASLGRPGARYAPKEVREAFGWFKGRIQNEQVYHVESRKNYNVNADQILDYGDIDIVAYDEQQTIQNAYQSTKEIIEKEPRRFIAQEVIDFQGMEVMDGEEKVLRKTDLRAFVLSGEKTRVWPSGLTRVSRNADSFVVNSSQGGGFKDTWVLSQWKK